LAFTIWFWQVFSLEELYVQYSFLKIKQSLHYLPCSFTWGFNETKITWLPLENIPRVRKVSPFCPWQITLIELLCAAALATLSGWRFPYCLTMANMLIKYIWKCSKCPKCFPIWIVWSVVLYCWVPLAIFQEFWPTSPLTFSWSRYHSFRNSLLYPNQIGWHSFHALLPKWLDERPVNNFIKKKRMRLALPGKSLRDQPDIIYLLLPCNRKEKAPLTEYKWLQIWINTIRK
jgi:hypothetical protein